MFYRTDDGQGWMHVASGQTVGGGLPCGAPRLHGDADFVGSRCGRVSVGLCDAPIGGMIGGTVRTCDRPLCARHTTPGTGGRSYCPEHAHLAPA